MFMQNNVDPDSWDLAQTVQRLQVKVIGFRFVVVQIELDWFLTMKKQVLKEGLRRLLFAVDQITNGRSMMGLVGITPRSQDYEVTKVKTVTFNRQLVLYSSSFGPNSYRGTCHFLDADGQALQPVERYFNKNAFQ